MSNDLLDDLYVYQFARDKLLEAAKAIAPSDDIQISFEKMVLSMEENHLSRKEICRQIALSIVTGLSNDNWPTSREQIE